MAAAPPRMLLLSGGGHEAFVALPINFDVSCHGSCLSPTTDTYGVNRHIMARGQGSAEAHPMGTHTDLPESGPSGK